jgi:hypothetical protein
MFTINNIIITFAVTGFAAIVFITYLLTRQHNKVTDLMQLNKDVPPLFLQRATQHKFNSIRTKLPNAPSVHHEKIKSKLEELVTDFKNETICIRTYNKGLDGLLEQLKKSS